MSKPKVRFVAGSPDRQVPGEYIEFLKLENMKLKKEIDKLLTHRPEKKDDIEEKFKGKLTSVKCASKFRKSA